MKGITPLPVLYLSRSYLFAKGEPDFAVAIVTAKGKKHGPALVTVANSYPQLVEALEAAQTDLGMFYDRSEDGVDNPPMQSVGLTLRKIHDALAAARKE